MYNDLMLLTSSEYCILQEILNALLIPKGSINDKGRAPFSKICFLKSYTPCKRELIAL